MASCLFCDIVNNKIQSEKLIENDSIIATTDKSSYSEDEIISISGEENLSTYQFGTNIAKHYFCKNCGIYTHHQRKSDPNGIGVNIGCIDDIDSFQYDADVLDMKSK